MSYGSKGKGQSSQHSQEKPPPPNYKLEDFRYLQEKLHVNKFDQFYKRIVLHAASPKEIEIFGKLQLQSQKKYPYVHQNVREMNQMLWLMNGNQKVRTLSQNQVVTYREETQKYYLAYVKQILNWVHPSDVRDRGVNWILEQYKKKKKDCPLEMRDIIDLLKFGGEPSFRCFERFWPVLTIVRHPAHQNNWIKSPIYNVYYRALSAKENEYYQKVSAKHREFSSQVHPSLTQSTNEFFIQENPKVQSKQVTHPHNPQNQMISSSRNSSSRVSQTSQDHPNASLTQLQAKQQQLHRNYTDLQTSYQQKEQEIKNSRQFNADKIGECQRLNESYSQATQYSRLLETQKQKQSTEIMQLKNELSRKDIQLTDVKRYLFQAQSNLAKSRSSLEEKLKEAQESIGRLNRFLKDKEQELRTIKNQQSDRWDLQRNLGISSPRSSQYNDASFKEELAKANSFVEKYKEELKQAKKIAEDASAEVGRLQTLLAEKEKGLVQQITKVLTLCKEQSENAKTQAKELKQMLSTRANEIGELKNREKYLEAQLNTQRSKSSNYQHILGKQREDENQKVIQSISQLCASAKSACSQMSFQVEQKWQKKCSTLEAENVQLKSNMANLRLKMEQNINQARQSARIDQQKVEEALERQKEKSRCCQIEVVRLNTLISKDQRSEESKSNKQQTHEISTYILNENARLLKELDDLKQTNKHIEEQICLNEKKVLSKYQLDIQKFTSQLNKQAAKRVEDEKSRVRKEISTYQDSIAALTAQKAALNGKLQSAEKDSSLYLRTLSKKDFELKQKDAAFEQKSKQLIAMLKEIMQLLSIKGRYSLEVQFAGALKQIKASINFLISRQKKSADLSQQLTREVEGWRRGADQQKALVNELWNDYSAQSNINKIIAKYQQHQQNAAIWVILRILQNMRERQEEFSVLKSSFDSQIARQTKELQTITSELQMTKQTLKLHEQNIERQKGQTNSSADKLRSESEALRVEIGKTNEKLRQMGISLKKYETQIQRLTPQIEQFKRREEESKSQLMNASKSEQKKDQIIATLKRDLEQERKKNNTVFQFSKETEGKKGQLETEIAELKRRLEDTLISLEKQKEEMESLRIRQSQVDREKKHIEEKFKKMNNDFVETETQVKSAKSELEKAKLIIEEKERQIALFQVQISNLQREVSDFDQKYKLRFMDQLKSLSKELSHRLKNSIELRNIESIFDLVISISNGSQTTTTLSVSPLLQKEPSQRTFLINGIEELTCKKAIGSKLLFFMDRFGQKSIREYFPTPGGPQGNFAFVLLIRTKSNHIFGGFSEGVCDKECNSYGSFLFSLTNALLFKKNPKPGQIQSCKNLDGFLILGNNELRIKFSDCSKVQTYAKSNARYFNFEREKMIGKEGKDDDWIAVQNFELHEIEFEQ